MNKLKLKIEFSEPARRSKALYSPDQTQTQTKLELQPTPLGPAPTFRISLYLLCS